MWHILCRQYKPLAQICGAAPSPQLKSLKKPCFNSYISCVLFLGPTSGGQTGGDNSDDDRNRNILIGILVPVILILLVVVIILTIGVIIVVKR